MKKSSLLMIVTVTLLTACGTASQYAASSGSARFEDGIYSSAPSFMSKGIRNESQKEADALVEKTKASKIYLFGDKKDTVVIPENMSARIQYDKSAGSTIITVGENPYDWQNYIDPWGYYTPYSIGSAWYWSRHYNPWYSGSWYWNTWAYTPWNYYGWYDPFYIGGWYDPWYYGYGGWYGSWYSPWYGGWYPHYAGWYGGWDPYWSHHHYHGTVTTVNRSGASSRREATGERIHGGSGARRGTALTSRADRELRKTSVNASGTGSAPSRPARVATAVRTNTSESVRTSASPRPVTNYRKPKIATGSSLETSTSSATVRQPSATSRPAGTSYRSDSPTERSSSEYRSSRSTSGSRSSYSGSSRSSYGGGSGSSGGGSRSGGYSGGRR